MRESLATAMLFSGIVLGTVLLVSNYSHKGAGCDEHKCWANDGHVTTEEGPGFNDVNFNPLLPGRKEGELQHYQSYAYIWHEGCWWKEDTAEHICQRAVSAKRSR